MRFIFQGYVALVLAAVGLGIPLKEQVKPFAVNYRLPRNILPTRYALILKPYLRDEDGLKQFTFDGEATVDFQTAESNVRTVILHSRHLTYISRKLYETSKPEISLTISGFSEEANSDKTTLNLADALVANTSYTLHFKYTGILGDDMYGFYRSSYLDSNNKTKWLGSTQFETISARRVFPSFDEPNFKATFDLSIIRYKSFKAVSNNHLLRTENINDGYYKDVFATTPKMSTYLLAFLVSEFHERVDGDFSVMARPEFYDQSKYASVVGQKLLTKFDEYTKLPYYKQGIDKMHMAAIPDFASGAMENWGLLTFREWALLYHETESPLSFKQSIATIVSHEQAHMWFGDLVTCDWWSYTWLNEGFATYFEYFLTAEVHPEMELEKQFVVDQIQSVFFMDSTVNTSPMSDRTAASPADLSRMFNSISYNKGGAFIRMVKHAIGEANFRKSLQSYLNEFKYQNTVPKNIFNHWKANWPADTLKYADGVLSRFTEQVGYPVIYIQVANDFKSMTLEQKRFLLKQDDGSNKALLYTVPFTYTTSVEKNFSATTPKVYLEPNTAKTTVQFPGAIDWVIGNIQETGYYRVNYTTAGWHQIHHALKAISWSGIHELNRAQFVDDLLALARAGEVTYDLALDCLDYLETETNYLPWTAAFNGLHYIAIRLGLDKQNFANYINHITKKVYETVGFEQSNNDTPLEIYTRNNVLAWTCKYGHKECIEKCLSIFRNIKTTPVPVNIRSAVYCTTMRDGTEADFDVLYNKFKAETVPTEKVLIMNTLGCVRDEKLVERYFNIIVSHEIRRQDKSAALSSLYSDNAENVSPVFKLVTLKYKELAESMGSYSSVAFVISNIASRFTTEEQQKELESFIKSNGNDFGDLVTILNNALTAVKENLAWAEKRLGGVIKYLEGYRGSAASTTVSIFTVTLVMILGVLLH